jgi:2-polyprenyl-3-methyl-5-hydroxy-6-metoxy-1,4-benzoquinol methylase
LRQNGQTRRHGVFLDAQPQTQSLFIGHLAAEYVLQMLPKGTHDFKTFIKPFGTVPVSPCRRP